MNSYDDLVSAINDWLDRDDLDTRAPDFIRLAEARLNRVLDDPEMEVVSETVADGDYTSLPDDFGSMVSISTGDGRLAALGPVQFAAIINNPGVPRYYSIVGRQIAFAPANSSATISMVYRRRIPALTSSDQTNWLLSLAPDVYLYASLVQAEAFLAEDDRVGAWKDALDEALAELRSDGDRRKWGAGPIAPRLGRQ